jgi:hypothetical protein
MNNTPRVSKTIVLSYSAFKEYLEPCKNIVDRTGVLFTNEGDKYPEICSEYEHRYRIVAIPHTYVNDYHNEIAPHKDCDKTLLISQLQMKCGIEICDQHQSKINSNDTDSEQMGKVMSYWHNKEQKFIKPVRCGYAFVVSNDEAPALAEALPDSLHLDGKTERPVNVFWRGGNPNSWDSRN